MEVESLTVALKAEALRLGFDLVGACQAVPPPGFERFRQWLEAGCAGEMRYMADRFEAYQHAGHVLDGARSILMLAMSYRTVEPSEPAAGQGRVSRYAWGDDYHDLIRARLRRLADFHGEQCPGVKVRGVVDTAPLLEREFAKLAGLGWIGKNTLLLNRRLGSWLFLAALLTGEELDYDEPFEGGHCGTCRACIDACPTGALVEPYLLDARKCISYLTIELRASVPSELRAATAGWLFGCDVCQDVCPWNRKARVTGEESFQPLAGMNPVELAELFLLDESAFRRRFRKTPLWRPRRRGLLRNAALILGSRPTEPGRRGLTHGLNDEEPVVRVACAWALGRHRHPDASRALQSRLAVERDPEARAEILIALGRSPARKTVGNEAGAES